MIRTITRTVEACIVVGLEGDCLYVNGLRVAGPKPWGGGRVKQTFNVRLDYLREATKGIRSRRAAEVAKPETTGGKR